MDALAPLFDLHPQAASQAEQLLANRDAPQEQMDALAAFGAEALLKAPALGAAVLSGLARLCGLVPDRDFFIYIRLVKKAMGLGVTFGAAFPLGLSKVMEKGGPRLRARYLGAVYAMNNHGAHTLKLPLEGLEHLLDDQDMESARAYLECLLAAYSHHLTYHQALFFTQALPKLTRVLHQNHRAFQLVQYRDVVRVDPRLAEPFTDGLEKGLAALSQKDLGRFVGQALERFPDILRYPGPWHK